MSGDRTLLLARDEAGFIDKAAELFVDSFLKAVHERNQFVVGLSGGSTPQKIYAKLADPAFKSRIDWNKVIFLWGDERCVPPQDHESNFRLVKEALFSKVIVPENNILRIPGEMESPRDAAKAYENKLHAFFKLDYAIPRMDLCFLGVGEDGHTASLFPKTDALNESKKWVVANFVDKFSKHRITLTFPMLNASRRIVFLVSGTKKAAILKGILSEGPESTRYPAQRIRPTDGELIWLMDKPAAELLPPEIRFSALHL